MKLGLLEAGLVNPALSGTHGDNMTMYGSLFRAADPTIEPVPFRVVEGVMPESPEVCDAWLVTGSKFGVYDNEPWIEPLKTFLRSARAAGVPMIGICFGHQIMAEAFGGRAEKSGKGWGCGVHDYEVTGRPGWMAEAGTGFGMHAMHQDQVTAVPGDATVLATSPFCEFAMLSYGDAERPDAISIQPHPEFLMPYARDLVELRRGELIPEDTAQRAMDSFGRPVANTDFADWALRYLRTALAARQAA